MSNDPERRGQFLRAPQYKSRQRGRKAPIVVGCSVALVLSLLLLFAILDFVGKVNPNSPPMLVLHGMGIRIFEPDYVSRTYGLKLHYGFMSYSSVSEIVSQLRTKGIEYTPADSASRDLPPNGNKPPFVMQEMVCPAYPIGGGTTTELRLLFFNDRLMLTRALGKSREDQRLSNEYMAYIARYS